MTYNEELIVGKKVADEVKSWLQKQPMTEDETHKEFLHFSVFFKNGCEADIRFHPVAYRKGKDNRPYTEVILMNAEGFEIYKSQPEGILCGIWEFSVENDLYHIHIKAA